VPPESALSPVFQIASDLVDQLAALDPIAATSMGVSGHDAEMSDYSPSGQEAVTALFRSTLERLQHAPVTNARDRTAAEAMRDSLSLRIERFDAGEQLDAMYRSPVVAFAVLSTSCPGSRRRTGATSHNAWHWCHAESPVHERRWTKA